MVQAKLAHNQSFAKRNNTSHQYLLRAMLSCGLCGLSCNGGGNCAHDKCVTGSALVNGCDACVSQVCAQDSFCCNVAWDSFCVSEVGTYCGLFCP